LNNLSEKPSWDNYFMAMAFLVSQRSIDPNTKCGCVIVSEDNRILSCGYNGPIRGSDDLNIPLTRDFKYGLMIHSEMNAIFSYNGSFQELKNSKCYVTIRPCHDCLRSLIQKGITKIYYSNLPNAKCVDEYSLKIQEIILSDHNISLIEVKHEDFIPIFDNTKKYIENKLSLKTV